LSHANGQVIPRPQLPTMKMNGETVSVVAKVEMGMLANGKVIWSIPSIANRTQFNAIVYTAMQEILGQLAHMESQQAQQAEAAILQPPPGFEAERIDK
jgi:hypothetical protein